MPVLEKLKKPENAAALSAAVTGLLVHMYGLVTALHNYDDIAVQPAGYGTGTASGRWLLTIFGDLFQKLFGAYNLPWLNGILFILLIALAAGFIVSLLDIRNPRYGAVIGMIFVSFPAFTNTMFFRYTVIYYGIAMLMSVLAAWIIDRHRLGIGFSALLTMLGLAIYQGYVPVTITLLVMLLIRQTLQDNVHWKQLLKKAAGYAASLAAGLVMYFVSVKISVGIKDVALNSYQGINQMGKISLGKIPELLWRTFSNFYTMPAENHYALATMNIVKIAYICLWVICLLILGYTLYIKKPAAIMAAASAVLMCIVFPMAVDFIVFMCPDSIIYTIMVYSFALVLCLPFMLIENMPSGDGKWKQAVGAVKKAAVIAVGIVIFCYSYQANVNYTAMYYTNRQIENYVSGIVTQVRMTEDFDSTKKWAFIGKIDDPLMGNVWQNQQVIGAGSTNNTNRDFLVAYSWKRWFGAYTGYNIPLASDDSVQELKKSAQVQEMPCWPDNGSVQVIGDTVVIKFQDEPAEN